MNHRLHKRALAAKQLAWLRNPKRVLAGVMQSHWYVMDKRGNPVPCDDIFRIERLLASKRRILGHDRINGFLVSTIFLCLDHGWNGVPILFETMILKPKGGEDVADLDGMQWRYATRREARAGHANAIKLVRQALQGATT